LKQSESHKINDIYLSFYSYSIKQNTSLQTMKKWEEQQHKKLHEKKILGAKSTFSSKNSIKTTGSFASPTIKGQHSTYSSNLSQSPLPKTSSDLSRISN